MCTRSVYDPGRPVSSRGQNRGSLGRLLVLMCLALVLPSVPAHADLQLLSPNGGQSWPPGSQQTIQWTVTSDPVTIQLFVDGTPQPGSMPMLGVSTTLTTNATGGSYSFIVPDVATTRARIQLSTDQNNIIGYVHSVNPFTIVAPPGPTTWS